MLILAELKSQGGNWNLRDVSSQLRNSRRNSPRRQESPKDKSRELIQIYFDQDDEQRAATKATTRNVGSLGSYGSKIAKPDSIANRASQTFRVFPPNLTSSNSTRDNIKNGLGHKTLTLGRQALMN